MILTGTEICNEYVNDRIHINPFIPEHIRPNSYDVRLAEKLLTYDGPMVLDPKKPIATIEHHIGDNGYVLQPGILYLGSTIEEIGSDHYVPMLDGRSSIGRLGISVHITAGRGDLGFKGRWTLEITVVHPTRLYAGMRIGQVWFLSPQGAKSLQYSGKYSGQSGVEPSKSWKDFG